MKARIYHGVGINRCSLNFFYEDYQGDRRYGFYNEAKNELGKDGIYLTSAVYNAYFHSWERVYTEILTRKPTIKHIKEFIQESLDILQWPALMPKKDSVLFRIDNKTGIDFAIFPYISYRKTKRVLVYCPLGQHFEGDYERCIRTSTPATPEQYNRLYKELHSIGYCLQPIQRAQHHKMYQL